MTETAQKETNETISLEAARLRIQDMDITQHEIMTLARLKARRLGLGRARKLARSNVSMFLYNRLPVGHVRTAILYTIEDCLGVNIDRSTLIW